MRANFTDLFIRTAKAPEKGQADYWDAKFPGFGLRVSQGGRKTWVAMYRYEGRLRRLTLGRYPVLSLADARAQAKLKLADAMTGTDPATVKEAARSEATWGVLVERYIADYARAHKKSWRGDETLLRLYVPEAWGPRKLTSFTRTEMARLHANVGREHGQSSANHLIRLIRSMFNLARDWELLASDNPAARIKLFSENRRERYLSPDEIKRVNTALAEESNPYWRAFFALALLTGCRRSELLGARFEMINFATKTLTLPMTKNGRPHVLPLSAAAVAIFSSLPSRRAAGWVFPSVGACGHLIEPKNAWNRICARAGVTDCRVHDLRHSLASILIQNGVGIALVGKILNHKQISTTERYSHLALDNMRVALDDAAGLIGAGTPDALHEN